MSYHPILTSSSVHHSSHQKGLHCFGRFTMSSKWPLVPINDVKHQFTTITTLQQPNLLFNNNSLLTSIFTLNSSNTSLDFASWKWNSFNGHLKYKFQSQFYGTGSFLVGGASCFYTACLASELGSQVKKMTLKINLLTWAVRLWRLLIIMLKFWLYRWKW